MQERLAREAVTNGSQLKEERAELQRQAANIVDAIAKHGISSFLSAQLGAVEARLAEIDRLLTARPQPKLPTFSNEQIREFLRRQSQHFSEILVGDPERAKQEIQKRIAKLVLTPKDTPDSRRLEVTGDVALFVRDDVMPDNSLEGIAQHYIAAIALFSGVFLNPSLPVAV